MVATRSKSQVATRSKSQLFSAGSAEILACTSNTYLVTDALAQDPTKKNII